jgi:hypothetical protein
VGSFIGFIQQPAGCGDNGVGVDVKFGPEPSLGAVGYKGVVYADPFHPAV